MSLYLNEELNLLNEAVPDSIFLVKGKKPYRINYSDNVASIRVKIQDLYEVQSHPKVVFGQHLVTFEILAPNDRCVQITKDLNQFWTGSYLEIKKELAGRYPKHEWK